MYYNIIIEIIAGILFCDSLSANVIFFQEAGALLHTCKHCFCKGLPPAIKLPCFCSPTSWQVAGICSSRPCYTFEKHNSSRKEGMNLVQQDWGSAQSRDADIFHLVPWLSSNDQTLGMVCLSCRFGAKRFIAHQTLACQHCKHDLITTDKVMRK